MSQPLAKFSQAQEPGVLSALLALTSDAVFVFNEDGSLLFFNEEGQWLVGSSAERLAGTDIRDLFLTSSQERVDAPSLPFATDGSGCAATVRREDGTRLAVTVRCDHASGAGAAYVAVARPLNDAGAYTREHDRLLTELSRANHRLAGTLRIVLDTLEAEDLDSLFNLVLEELRDTMDATGAVIYFGATTGFHLGGVSDSLRGHTPPSYLSYGSKLPSLVSKASGALRMRLLVPSRDSLRSGVVADRELLDEDAHITHEVPQRYLPPFVSFYCVPVWYGERLIAFFELGWNKVHPTSRDDSRLLEAVSRYLSVQLMSAITAQRIARQSMLDRLADDVHDELVLSKEPPTHELYLSILGRVSAELSCVGYNAAQRGSSNEVVVSGEREEVALALPDAGEVRVTPVSPEGGVGSVLVEHEWPAVGALLDIGEVFGERHAALFLREETPEPLEQYELDFLQHLGEVARDVTVAAGERGEQMRISQALQMGMRSALQEVDGLFAEGIYSSATASAYVGGDFYDLVRLPEGRACVLLGDVSGHGVEAASVSSAVRTAVEAYSWEGLSPARIASLLNDFLLGLGKLETFATLFVGIIDTNDGQLTYCSAGHPPAMLLKAESGDIELLDVQSGAVGAFPEMAYHDGSVRMEVGDALLLYTDGVIEARSPEGVFVEEDGFLNAVARESEQGVEGLVGRLLDAVDAYTGRHLNDDVAMVCLRYDGLQE